MSPQLIITLLLIVAIIVMFLSGKVNFGFIGMFLATALCVTGVLSFNEAYANFASTNVIMFASMFVMAGALQKTSLVSAVRNFILKRGGKGGSEAIMYFAGVTLLTQFVSPLAVIAMMMPLCGALGEDSPVAASQLLYPGSVMSHGCQSLIPFGSGLTYYITANALLEANGAAEYQLNIFDKSLSMILPAAITFIYCAFFAWKMFPKRDIDAGQIKDRKDGPACDPVHEKIIFLVFALVMVGLIIGSKLPFPMYIVPLIGDLVLGATGCMNMKEVKASISLDSVLMMAGVLCLGTAMQKTGAAEVLGNVIVKMLGGDPAPIVVLIAFLVVGAILTQLMSNTATYQVLVPLAIVTAMTMGMDPRGMVLAISCATTGAMLTPMSSPSVAIAFGAGKHTLKEVFLPMLPLFIIRNIAIVISVNLLYPVW